MTTNLTQYLDKQYQKRKQKIAVQDDIKELTFGELYLYATALSNKIHELSEGIVNQPIIVFCGKGIITYSAMMGILYSGNYYVPLDTHMPKERLKKILQLVKAEIILTSSDNMATLCDIICHEKVVVLDTLCVQTGTAFIHTWRDQIIDSDPAYVLFTSGSTGVPKGVVVSHRAVIDYIEWQCNTLPFSDKVILGNQAPFYFDASVPDIYTPLATGATLTIIPEEYFMFPNKLISYLNEKKINTLIWVPSALMQLSYKDYFKNQLIANLRLVMFCGEVMPTKHLNIWRRYYPDAKFVNLYGPTEATYACTYYEIDRKFEDDQPLPIGKACENTSILLLDEDDNVIHEGVGEICIRGTCLASGYYRDEQKTNKSFVRNPSNIYFSEIIYRTGDMARYNENRELEYIGRKDFQIKHQGYRIELGEIEAAAYGIAQMRQCCAIYDSSQRKIVLFCAISSPISEKEIYSFMKAKVPKYMLPGKIQLTDSLPLNANGKIDREALREKWENKICF